MSMYSLNSLLDKAISVANVAGKKTEEVVESSILRPFMDFIFSEDSSVTVDELQHRIRRAYTSVMAGLMRTKLLIKKLKFSMAELESERVALRDSKLKELPTLLLDSMNAKEVLALIPCLRVNETSSL